MNKFRNNLHSAFYEYNENGLAYRETLSDKNLEIEDIETETREDLNNLREDIDKADFFREDIDKADFSKIADSIIKEKEKTKYFEENKERFEKRLQSENSEGKKYKDVWNEKIEKGFTELIKMLNDKKFFDSYENEAKKEKIKEVEMKYRNQVKVDYTTNIWDADDKKFNKIKDTIFDVNANKSSQIKTFYELINQDNSKLKEITIRSNAAEKIGKDGVEADNEKTRQRINFLAHELPNFLREVKDPKWHRKYIFKVDAPSEKDREEITNFIRVVDKLGGNDIEVKLIKIFDSLEKGAGNDKIKEKLEENDLTLKNDKHIAKIKKVFDFYKDVMNPNNQLQDQHAIYIDVLTRIEKEGGFDKTIAAYKEEISKLKKKKKAEGKEYEKGKTLDQNLKTFADALNIAVSTNDKKLSKKVKNTTNDYTRITRLSEKTDFQNANIVDILADLNNDGEILPSDSGTLKTGTQFKELYNFVLEVNGGDEKIILSNLLDQAKLYNSLLDKGVQIQEEEFTSDQIKAGNKKLILMLQTIISLPGQDLYTLMLYGPDATARQSEIYESLKNMPESAEDPSVQEGATKLLKDNGIEPGTHLDGVTYDGLHQAVAGALFRQYSTDVENMLVKGAGIGTDISFDQWVKGLSLNGGFQMTEKGPGFGLTLSYKKEFDRGKGWLVTPGAHCGFIMLGTMPAFDAGLSVEPAKQWINDNYIAQKFGGQLSFDYITPAVLVFSVLVGWSRDKLKGIEQSKDKMKQAFNNEIVSPLLDSIAQKFGDEEFDLTQEQNISRVNKAIDEIINKVLGDKKSEFKSDDIKKLKENTVRLLINYNNAPIKNKDVRKSIASEISEIYAAAWAEQSIDGIEDSKLYFSGARLGASWVQVATFGAHVFHLGISLKKHRKDGYGDVSKREYKIEALSGSKRDQNMVDHMNKYLDKDAKISLSTDGKYVVLSPKVVERYDILFDPKMKGLMKKDNDGNILLSVETFIHLPSRTFGSATKHTYILIGGSDAGKAVNDNKIDNSWFAEGEIDTGKLPGKESVFTSPILEKVLQDLKNKPKLKNDTAIQDFKFDYDSILPQLSDGKQRYKIILEKDGDTIKTPIVTKVDNGDALQIEYIADETVELMDRGAQEIANKAYLEARKVESNALYSISHGKYRWKSYVNFANAMRNKEYAQAKNIIIDMLPRMDNFINKYQKNKVNFSSMIDGLNNLESEVELGQALLSINNIFARVSSVQGGKTDDIYHFRKYEGGKYVEANMGSIIQTRAGEIERKINKSSLTQDVKDSYTSLIGAMENYRENNPEYYNTTSKKRTTLQNAVGINLGNAINIENPLFNPEIYQDSQISLKDLPNFQGKDTLQQHAMEVMAKDKSLMGPILKKLNISLDGGNTINYKFISYKDGELTIDISDKKVKFKAGMSVGYFSQCVNHMILLDNIEVKIEGQGDSVNYGPGVMSGGKVIEGTKGSVVATSKFNFDIAGGLGKHDEGKPVSQPEDGGIGNNNKQNDYGI